MVPRSFARLLFAALIACSLGCDDPLSPLDLAGTYILEDADTGTLSPDDPPGTIRVLGDTIRLHFNLSGTHSSTFERLDVDGDIERLSVSRGLGFSIDGDRFLITPGCPANVTCMLVLRTYAAHRTATGFRMVHWNREGEELHYLKVD